MARAKSVNIPADLYLEIKKIGAANEGATVPYLVRKVMREWVVKNPVISITKPNPSINNRPLPPDTGSSK